MSDKTAIEWTDATWNPVRGCSRISPGCGGSNHQGGCYAEKIAARFSDPGMPFHGFAERSAHGGRWTGKMALVDQQLDQPLRWKKPRRIFVNSMSDLFHKDLPDEAIDKIFAIMALASHHTFQVLTKRADRLREYSTGRWRQRVRPWLDKLKPSSLWNGNIIDAWHHLNAGPLPNVWLGVSVEDPDYKHRIDQLRRTPAAVRFVSAEPLLEDLGELDLAGIHQVIVGGESGPRSRAFWVPNARSILRQCRRQKVACFIKQMGAKVTDRNDIGFEGCDEREWPLTDLFGQLEHDIDGYSSDYQGAPVRIRLKDRKGGDMAEWPEELRVREFPQ